MEEINKLIADVSRPDWGGHPVSSLRIHLMEVYGLIKWFFERTTNEYLGRPEKAVLKSIKTDSIPNPYREVLLKAEIEGKNRKKIVESLNDSH